MWEEQQAAAEFARTHALNMDPQVRFLDLASELGELSKELLKASDYGKCPLAATEEMEKELGDCIFSMLCLCDSLQLDSESALHTALEKYRKRFAEKGGIGSGA